MLMALESAPPPMCMQPHWCETWRAHLRIELARHNPFKAFSESNDNLGTAEDAKESIFHSFSQDCKEKANEIGNDDIHLTNRHFFWMAIKTKMMIYDDEDDDTSNIPRNKRNNSADDGDGHNSNDIDDGSALQVCFPWLDSMFIYYSPLTRETFLVILPPWCTRQDQNICSTSRMRNCWQFHRRLKIK